MGQRSFWAAVAKAPTRILRTHRAHVATSRRDLVTQVWGHPRSVHHSYSGVNANNSSLHDPEEPHIHKYDNDADEEIGATPDDDAGAAQKRRLRHSYSGVNSNNASYNDPVDTPRG